MGSIIHRWGWPLASFMRCWTLAYQPNAPEPRWVNLHFHPKIDAMLQHSDPGDFEAKKSFQAWSGPWSYASLLSRIRRVVLICMCSLSCRECISPRNWWIYGSCACYLTPVWHALMIAKRFFVRALILVFVAPKTSILNFIWSYRFCCCCFLHHRACCCRPCAWCLVWYALEMRYTDYARLWSA